MTTYHIAVLPGDGIGPEVVAAGLEVLRVVADRFGLRFRLSEYPIGGAAVASHQDPFPGVTRDAVRQADAVLLGAVGDPSLDSAPRHLKPETGLLALRASLGVYANLRPVALHPALADCSPLRPERLTGVDLVIVRELTGGLYYGEPRSNDGTIAISRAGPLLNTSRKVTKMIAKVSAKLSVSVGTRCAAMVACSTPLPTMR